jgi:hypothetical protein
MQWHAPVVPATPEAMAGGLMSEAGPGLKNKHKMLSEKYLKRAMNVAQVVEHLSNKWCKS